MHLLQFIRIYFFQGTRSALAFLRRWNFGSDFFLHSFHIEYPLVFKEEEK